MNLTPKPRKAATASTKAKLPRIMAADYDPEYTEDVAFQVYPKPEDSCRYRELEQFPVLVLDWSAAGKHALVERFANIIGSRKSGPEFKPFFKEVDRKQARALVDDLERWAMSAQKGGV